MNAFVRVCTRFVYRIAYNMHFEGLENIPEKEGIIIASNHRSYADPVLLTMYMKRPVKYMAKEELFKNKFFAAFIRMLGASPVKRGPGDMKAAGMWLFSPRAHAPRKIRSETEKQALP